MYSYGPPHIARQKQDDQHEHTFSSYVWIRDVALKPYQRRWTIKRSGKRGSGISVLAARHDDDDDFEKNAGISLFLFIVIYTGYTFQVDLRIRWLYLLLRCKISSPPDQKTRGSWVCHKTNSWDAEYSLNCVNSMSPQT